MKLYSMQDMQDARKRVHKYALLLGAVSVFMMVLYVFALVNGIYALSAVLALMLLVWCLTAGDLLLMPWLRYARFLKEMEKGLRRHTLCILESISDDAQMQDGVLVRSLQVRLNDAADTRILYVNASKTALLPGMNAQLELISYGCHVIEFMEN